MNTLNYKRLNFVAEKNAVVVFGGSSDRSIPVAELSESYGFNFKIYNRSIPELSLRDAMEAFNTCISSIRPEGILIHLGEEDADLFRNCPSEFDRLYLNLIEEIKKSDPKVRIALVSVIMPQNCKLAADMNRHIKAIADSENCDFVNLDRAANWKPESTKEVISFVYSLGFVTPLNIKKPLNDIAKILYSYAVENISSSEGMKSNYA